ncbi:MAG: cytochrome c maturation protein CcmE [Kofleriaceae bacterium]|nr:cytochrome c maturation protein CcmE [Kofleriaceae bacterium]MCL4225550.1 cytochrome c maturation protein CcmE [Myxococcales bacterium]
MSTARKVLATVAVLGTVALLWFSARGHTSHYKMVDEVVLAPDTWVGRPLRVHGFVEVGSVRERVVDQELHRTFVLEHRSQRLRVRNVGPAPDTFRDGAEVVAEGRLVQEEGGPVFVATALTAKCPSKYEGAHRDLLMER